MRIKIFFFVLITVLFSTFSLSAANTLFKNGKSKYVIVVNDDAFYSEKTAAAELHDYLKQISGADIPVTNKVSSTEKNVIIGFDEASFKELGISMKQPEEDDEGFTCFSDKGNIFIYGGSHRGTMYGVYSFLEKLFGVRWYAPDCTIVPKMNKFKFKDFSWSEEPFIKYRYSQYYETSENMAWSAHNRNNSAWTAEKNEYGGTEAYWSAHTMGQFIQSSEYFDKHPEYFALRNGKRIPNGQLCLSNPDVLELCKKAMRNAIETHPGYWVYSLSQNDNQAFCECEKCRAIEDKYGGHSGLILWFVNQVADYIKPLYPDKHIGTFAYQYTRHAPTGIVPRDNVVIRLCSIECCFAHSLEECEQNKSFVEDLKAWSKIAPTLYIWDYVVNFRQYVAPFPNFGVLAKNIKTFGKYNAIGVQEEAQYESYGGEFSEMKDWVLTRLLWNPNQDTDALVDEFMRGYYGDAAPYVREYFDMCQNLVKDDTHMGIYINYDNPLYNEEFISNSLDVLKKAKDAVSGDAQLADRVDIVRLQPLYLKIGRHTEESIHDGSYDEFSKIVRAHNIRLREGRPVDKMLEEMKGGF
jgi:hypothetical protein